jgi:hypothetical protein
MENWKKAVVVAYYFNILLKGLKKPTKVLRIVPSPYLDSNLGHSKYEGVLTASSLFCKFLVTAVVSL